MQWTYFSEQFFKKLGLDASEKGIIKDLRKIIHGEEKQNLPRGREHILAW